MQGMDGKQSGDKSAASQRSSHLDQQPEQQQRIDNVEEKIGQMMGAGIQPIELRVEHVR